MKSLVILLLQVKENCDIEGYDSKSFNAALTLPVAIQIRQHFMYIYMKYSFPEVLSKLFPSGFIPISLKEVWKWVVGYQIESIIFKKFEPTSPFKISITFGYKNHDYEVSLMLV